MDALPVILSVLVAPVILVWVNGWQRSREKKEDWARQDAKAKELKDELKAENAKTARLLVESQAASAEKVEEVATKAAVAAEKVEGVAEKTAEVAILLRESNEVAANAAQENSVQLAEIKEIANGSFTSQLKQTRLALIAHVVLITKNAALTEKLGMPIDPEHYSTIDTLRAEIGVIDEHIKARGEAASS